MKMCENGGCMAKISGTQLINMVYRAKKRANIENQLYLDEICNGKVEDCAVIKSNSGNWLFSTDFGPLVGNDSFTAGRIAALNALSDVYAMGGIPQYALVILCVGDNLLIGDDEEILAGVYKTCELENVSIVGGHTIKGSETMVGLSVLGKDGNYLIRKQGAHIGDSVWISKALGTGLVFRAYYHNLLSEKDYMEAVETALQSNDTRDILQNYSNIHAMTDITGYGLLGHLSEMLMKNQGAKIYMSQIPMLNALKNLSPVIMRNDYIMNNIHYVLRTRKVRINLNNMDEMVLFDPQTNGPIVIITDAVCRTADLKGKFVRIGEITDTPKIEFCRGDKACI
jgi:selenide,water dikinase